MSAPMSLIMIQFLAWVAERPRSYPETMDAWRTSCPRLAIWEDAADHGYVARESIVGFGLVVTVTEDGKRLLRAHGRIN